VVALQASKDRVQLRVTGDIPECGTGWSRSRELLDGAVIVPGAASVSQLIKTMVPGRRNSVCAQ
jgi:hypothetical protein